MNYLAHFHLAQASDDWIVGALLGDFVKGPLRGAWPAGWEQGMRLHRRIDAVSDRHPLRQQMAQTLPQSYRRYAGILLDVYGDYVLSRHWALFNDEPLAVFKTRVYGLLARHRDALPPPAARMATRLIDYDVLGIYHRWDTVAGTLERIGTRLRGDNPLRDAAAALESHQRELDENFLLFYPQLQALCAQWRQEEHDAGR